MQHSKWGSSQETEETPVSSKMRGNTGQGMDSCRGDLGVAVLAEWGLPIDLEDNGV